MRGESTDNVLGVAQVGQLDLRSASSETKNKKHLCAPTCNAATNHMVTHFFQEAPRHLPGDIKGTICTGIGFGFILKIEYGAWGGTTPSGGSGGGFLLDLGYPPQCSFHSVF